MTLDVQRRPDAAQVQRIRAVCDPCSEFERESFECRILRRGTQWFANLFADKRCRPREFIESFLRRRLAGRFGAERGEHIKDIASEVVLDLIGKPPRTYPSADLTGLRRVLAGRALQVQVDYWRKLDGRVRCGNCTHHRIVAGGRRECGHPSPEHPWAGREVPASLDPRAFEPPCERWASRRERVRDQLAGQDLLDRIPDSAAAPDAAVTSRQRAAILGECLAAVQRTEPRVAFVLMMSFLRHATNDDVATSLRTTVRTVTRYKERGLQLLRQELEIRGVTMLHDIV